MIPFDGQALVKSHCLSSGFFNVFMLYIIFILQNPSQLNECKMVLE